MEQTVTRGQTLDHLNLFAQPAPRTYNPRPSPQPTVYLPSLPSTTPSQRNCPSVPFVHNTHPSSLVSVNPSSTHPLQSIQDSKYLPHPPHRQNPLLLVQERSSYTRAHTPWSSGGRLEVVCATHLPAYCSLGRESSFPSASSCILSSTTLIPPWQTPRLVPIYPLHWP